MTATIVSATTAADRAYGVLRERIVSGEYPPGAMLSEAELGASLGLSRTPVRQALVQLREEGWVVIYPKRGVLVRALDEGEVAEMTAARVALEVAGVELATAEARRELAARLAPVLADQGRALARGDALAFVDLTMDFHQAFVAVARNRYLSEMCDRLNHRQRQLLLRERDVLVARATGVLAEHQELLERLAANDPAGFAVALRAHVSATWAAAGSL